MAEKITNKDKQTTAPKKSKRRMKKQVRRTIAGLFLVSAIVVAAIPVETIQATKKPDGSVVEHSVLAKYQATGDTTQHSEQYGAPTYDNTTTAMSYYDNGANIPHCKAGTTIYSTGDGLLYFAYVDSEGDQASGSNKSAVILGYKNTGSLAGGKLVIPDKVDAYLNFNDNDGAANAAGSCAVGKSGNFLFYSVGDTTETYADGSYYWITPNGAQQTKNDELQWYVYYDSTGTGTFNPSPSETISETKRQEMLNDKDTYGEINKSFKFAEVWVDVYHNYKPCFYSAYDVWNGKTLYYYDTTDFKPTVATATGSTHKDTLGNLVPQEAADIDASYGRIANQTVTAIGNQYLNAEKNAIDGDITDANGSSKGIFANNSNITQLEIGENLTGIGDYAFYGCTNMNSIKTGNGIITLGNHCFDKCINMISVDIPQACNLKLIGAYAFKNCQSITSFSLPTSVETLGDGCFKDCQDLISLDLGADASGADSATKYSLSALGNYVFQGCKKLQYLCFRSGFSQKLEISEFENCNSLAYIKCSNSQFDIVASTTCNYDWDNFLSETDLNKEGKKIKDYFYVEAPESGKAHETCRNNEIAYKYPNEERYEVTKKEVGLAGGGGAAPTMTYVVNNNNELVDTLPNGTVTSLTFPEHIGPYGISAIGDNAFRDRCSLTQITIPASVKSIGTNAFMGCHNLKYVYFKTDTVEIGTDAFKTNEVTAHSGNCPSTSLIDQTATDGSKISLYSAADMTDSATNKPKVELGFVGTIDAHSTPYQYAMNVDGSCNGGSQSTAFITYYSGWPSMLTVQYHLTSDVISATKTGESELIDFPTKATLGEYANKDYLTSEQKDAANNAKTYVNSPSDWEKLRDDAKEFVKTAYILTIPTGIDSIQDGLFYKLTEAPAVDSSVDPMTVMIYGIDNIETEIDPVTNTPVIDKSDFYGCKKIKEILLAGDSSNPNTKNLDDYAFADCANLEKVTSNSPIEDIGVKAFSNDPKLSEVTLKNNIKNIKDYAFDEDTALTTVSIGDVGGAGEVGSLGLRPWSGCSKLSDVAFNSSNNYKTANSIVYELDNGIATKVVELLEGRSSYIKSDADVDPDLLTTTTFAEEAFMGNDNITSINLSSCPVSSIPLHAFADCTSLRTVTLPDTGSTAQLSLGEYIFEGCKMLYEVTGSSNITPTKPKALDGIIVGTSGGVDLVTDSTDTSNNNKVTIYAPEGSNFETYANDYDYNYWPIKETINRRVVFNDWDGTNIKTMIAPEGSAIAKADIPEDPTRDGYVFDQWVAVPTSSSLGCVLGDTTFTASYKIPPEGYGQHRVNFYYYQEDTDPDHTTPILYKYTYVNDNGYVIDSMEIPTPPTIEGYSFTVWGSANINNPITKDTDFYATYEKGYTVTFVATNPDTDEEFFREEIRGIEANSDATTKVSEPKLTGYKFSKWVVSTPKGADVTNVTSNILATAKFEDAKPEVQFLNYNGDILKSYHVKTIGEDAVPPTATPTRTGYTFSGWLPASMKTGSNDLYTFTAQFDYTGGGSSGGGSGSTSGNSSNNNGNSNNSSSSNSSSKKTYTVTVINGSGSGTYQEGSSVVIAANTPASGKAFSKWTTSDVTLVSTSLSATSFTMPSKNVTVTAEYVDSNSSGSGKSATGNAARPSSTNATTTGNTPTGNTSVIVTKPGVSNTNLASATVHGSTDSFVVRITETNEATTAVENALNNRYGSLDGIMYWACDISLYDASGNNRITDTTGLTVDVTVPIPDELRQYGGNNKAAAVANNQLEELNAKYNTVNGTPVMTFTATHFSPYTIYADTNNLNASQMLDVSPKTGDPIHPKWFLAIGLAAISVVLFLKKDKKRIPVKK